MQKLYIEQQEDLNLLSQQLARANVITIDTEFVRTRTFYPKLGLLQVCDGDVIALIDPTTIEDLSPFWQLLEDPKLEKVIHACSEDLEVFLTHGNCRPQNLIDSQIMMSFLGHGLSIGYAGMVQHYLAIELDKSDSRTDWLKRPLTESQIAYAQADVDYLYQLYPRLKQELIDSSWYQAAQLDTQLMIERKFATIDPDSLYQQIKMSWRLNSRQLNLLKYLAKWRFEQAQLRDLPLGFIAKDHTLIGLARVNPKSVGAMASIEGVELSDIRHKGKALLSVLKKANQTDEKDFPPRILRLDETPGYKQVFKKVKSYIKKVADQHHQAIENFASKKQINQFLSWHYKIEQHLDVDKDIDILRDWRKPLFGEQLLAHAKDNFTSL
ncbi:ribonuclease D [Thalassotalea ganghwensis]